MGRKHFKPEQIIKKLREAEVLFSNGESVEQVCSRAFAEEQAMMTARADRTDQMVQEMVIAKTPEDQPRIKKVLVLHTLKSK